MDPKIAERALRVRLLVLDVDGVLTDGTLWYGADGEVFKGFHVRDGLGLKLLASAGIQVAVISGKSSAPLERRLDDLGVEHRYLGRRDKNRAFDELLEATGLAAGDVAWVGDDLLDLPLMKRAGLAIAVADAEPRVRAKARWITTRDGGRGAVREICEGLLDARGELDGAIDALLEGLA